tara:strand:- start:802 stop:1008 length:207 start_codon:yes stop_codon:yes gene_type:complete
MAKKKKKDNLWWKDPESFDMWHKELIKRSTTAVESYEKYLLDELNYLELANIMKELRSILPISEKDNA